mgnify:CR=1 FL=1
MKTIVTKNKYSEYKQTENENIIKLNYIRHFICRNIKKINLVSKIEEFEFESSDESDYEYIDNEKLEFE